MNIQKFTQKSIEAMQNAQSLTIEHGNQQMEQVHLLSALIRNPEELVSSVLTKSGVQTETLRTLLKSAVDSLPKVSGGGVEADKIYVSREVEKVLSAAEKEADQMKDEYVSVEHILLALLNHPDKTTAQILKTAGIEKNAVMAALQVIRGNQRVTTDNPEGTYDVLLKYGQDLVELAREQKLDPVIGRDDEIRGVIQILSRKTKNNPCLIGEPGVGKTAIAEGLAQRIVRGDVPDNLKDVSQSAFHSCAWRVTPKRTIDIILISFLIIGSKYN